MSTRKYQLEFCQTCLNKKFSKEKGIVCSITNDIANFEKECKDYKIDEVASEHEKRKKAYLEEEELLTSTGGLSGFGVKNGIGAGILLIAFGFLWLFVGVFVLQRLFFYSLVLVVIGFITLVNGLAAANQERKKKLSARQNANILDFNNDKQE